MEEKAVRWDDKKKKRVGALILVAVMLLSVTLFRSWIGSPQAHVYTITHLDEKKDTVTALAASSASVSAALTFAPQDMFEPIADDLSDLSGCFVFVLSAIYLEKYLLTALGVFTSCLLIPTACLMMLAHMFLGYQRGKEIAIHLAILSVVLNLVVPSGVWLSVCVEETFEESIQMTLQSATDTEDMLAGADEEEEKGLWDKITDGVDSLINTASGALDWAKRALSRFIESIAIMIITNCFIPLLPLLFFIWLLRVLFNIEVHMPKVWGRGRIVRRGLRKRVEKVEEKITSSFTKMGDM